MLIESFAQNADFSEVHSIEIAAAPDVAYRALWTADMGGSLIVKSLLALRSLPAFFLNPRCPKDWSRKITLQTLLESGFGRLAEAPGREVVLGITGPFWRPLGNTRPFKLDDFSRPVPAGLARAVWNFSVQLGNTGQTVLSTETRITCGDDSARMKFRIYWMFVRPFSGLIRLIMLRAVRDEVRRNPE